MILNSLPSRTQLLFRFLDFCFLDPRRRIVWRLTKGRPSTKWPRRLANRSVKKIFKGEVICAPSFNHFLFFSFSCSFLLFSFLLSCSFCLFPAFFLCFSLSFPVSFFLLKNRSLPSFTPGNENDVILPSVIPLPAAGGGVGPPIGIESKSDGGERRKKKSKKKDGSSSSRSVTMSLCSEPIVRGGEIADHASSASADNQSVRSFGDSSADAGLLFSPSQKQGDLLNHRPLPQLKKPPPVRDRKLVLLLFNTTSPI